MNFDFSGADCAVRGAAMFRIALLCGADTLFTTDLMLGPNNSTRTLVGRLLN